MSLPSFMRAQTFELRRFPVTVDHGSESVDYAATPDTATFRGSVQPGVGATDDINRNGVEVVKTIYAVPEADVEPDDLIRLNGRDYFVNGEPERWEVGILDHLVLRLSRWKG